MSRKEKCVPANYPFVYSYVDPHLDPFVNRFAFPVNVSAYSPMVYITPQWFWGMNGSSNPFMWNVPLNPLWAHPRSSSFNISLKQSSYQKKESKWEQQWDSLQSPQSPWIQAYENEPEEM